MKLLVRLTSIIILLSSTYFLEAQSPDFPSEIIPSDWFKSLSYRNIGPFRGGRVTAVTGIPDQPFTFFMGSTGGGVWKTMDGGTSWQNISDGFFEVGSIGSIEVAPSDPHVIYVGTGSASPRGNISPGNGMYKSVDGGKTWEHIGLTAGGQIGKIVIHPHNPDRVYAAVLGNIFGPNTQRGVFRTLDGGKNWDKVCYVSDSTGAIDLVMHPDNPRILFAGFWRVERKPWTLIDGAAEGGLYTSRDGGDTWEPITKDLPTEIAGRIGIAISPVNPDRMWVIREAKKETQGGLYRSEDGGKSWKRINRSHKLRQRAWYYSRVFADPQDEHTVYVLNTRMHKSVDGGESFTTIATPHGDNHCLWINPHNPDIMIESNDGGANVSFNGGKTWSTQFNQPTAELYRVTVDNQFPYRVYGAQQDNSTISVPSSMDADITPKQYWYSVGGGESGHIAVDPRDVNIVYAGNYIGRIDRVDRARGHVRNVVAYPQMHDGVAPRDIKYRFQWNAPIRISPHDPDILYHTSQYVHRSQDGGQNWEVISPDLTTNNDAYHDIPGGPVQHDHTGVELYTTIFAFEESPHESGVLWAGTDDGRLHLSRDGGKNWEEITPKNIPLEGTINMIEVSPHDPAKAYIAVYKYRENDFAPYIFKTQNYGKSWKLITEGTNGIPSDHFVRVVREDLKREGLLYAGTEYGMYISFDDGKRWQSFQLNLPVTPITDMVVHRDDLVIATQGRSFWILDDLTPLHQIDSNVMKQKMYLFSPRPAYRTQLRGFRGDDAPEAASGGVVVHFYLDSEEIDTTDVQIELLSAEGEIIQCFATQPNKQKKEEKLRVGTGMNRWVWNMRYPSPDVLADAQFSLASTSGAKAHPGAYKVKLITPKGEEVQSFEILKDPRWNHISDEDIHAQFTLAQEVSELLTTCHAAIRKIRTVRDQIEQQAERAVKAGFDASLQDDADALSDQLTNLEEQLIQTRSESGQDPINYPPMLDDQIAYLYSTVNGQDARPTSGCYERFEDLKKLFAVHQKQLNQLLQEDVAAFESRLNQAGVPRIIPLDRR